jgi:carboxymethylenebutenolidase
VLLGDAARVAVATRRRRTEFSTPSGPARGTFYYPRAGLEPAPGVLVLHSAFGRTPHEDAAGIRLAKAGYVALVVSYSSRTSGTALQDRQKRASLERVTRRALEELAADPAVRSRPLGVIGFSLGGHFALELATSVPLQAAVVYYGVYEPEMAEAERWTPLLLHQGQEDEAPFVERAVQLAAYGVERNRPCELRRYPGAGHQFDLFQPRGAAARNAWPATVAFLKARLGAIQ